MIAAKINMKKLSGIALLVGILFAVAPMVKAEEAAKSAAPAAAEVVKKGEHAAHHADHKGHEGHKKDMKCECGKDAKECKGKKCHKDGKCDCSHHHEGAEGGHDGHKDGEKPADTTKHK